MVAEKEKISLMKSLLSARCPRCRNGKLYSAPLYSWKFMKMNAQCDHCGQPFILEPGFFLGSAFFSYFIYAVLLTAIALGWYFGGQQISAFMILVFMILVILALTPVVLRFSKSIWIHLFIRYEGPSDRIPRKG